jgi:hypothetical protein
MQYYEWKERKLAGTLGDPNDPSFRKYADAIEWTCCGRGLFGRECTSPEDSRHVE